MSSQFVFDSTFGAFDLSSNWTGDAVPDGSDDAWIGTNNLLSPVADIAVSGANASVASIGANSASQLIITDDSLFTAVNGTTLSASDKDNVGTGNQGSITVDAGSGMGLGGGTFANEGTLTLGYSTSHGGSSKLTIFGAIDLTDPYLASGVINFGASGVVNLGNFSAGAYSIGNIVGDSLVNVDDAIIGGGYITVTTLDNQKYASIQADQSNRFQLAITSVNFTNEGSVEAGANAGLLFGSDGVTQKMANDGEILLGEDGITVGKAGAYLAIAGDYTIKGDGKLFFEGAGAEIVSDGQAPDTFTNASTIIASTSGQIGDAGHYGGNIEDLTFDNDGGVYADGSGVILTLNTGSNTISDAAGSLEAENGGVLVVDSPTTTGADIPNGELILLEYIGAIVAAGGGSVVIGSSVTSGAPSVPGDYIYNFPVVAEAGSSVTIVSGGSVAVPIEIFGEVIHVFPTSVTPGGVVTQEAGGSITGTVYFKGVGATLNLNKTTASVSVSGNGGTINESNAQAGVVGSDDIINMSASGDLVSLYATDGGWDAVYGSGGQVNVYASQVSVLGGSDTIGATPGSSISLYKTAGNWDLLYGSSDQVALTSSQASIVGGSDTIGATSGSSMSLYSTGGAWDTVYGSDDQITLNSSQASVVGESNSIFATAGSSVSLYGTSGHADGVTASSDSVDLTNAQAGVVGSGDSIALAAGTTNTLYLSGTSENFYFAQSMGLTSINGFSSSDVIHLSAKDWSSFSVLQSSGDLQQSGANTLIALDASDTITLSNVTKSTLTSAQFVFS